jgi:hypothetical protein
VAETVKEIQFLVSVLSRMDIKLGVWGFLRYSPRACDDFVFKQIAKNLHGTSSKI